jgi:DNA modification methylase
MKESNNYERDKKLSGNMADRLASCEVNFKETFGGIPKSIMKFKKSKELMSLIDYDDTEVAKVQGNATARGGGYAKNIRYSIYNPDQADFIIKYYTKKDWLILDPFMGRFTRPMVCAMNERNYIGIDTCSKTVELNMGALKDRFPDASYSLLHGSGTDESVYSRYGITNVDAIFTCPPYYYIEKYSGENGDLSRLSIDEFDDEMKRWFKIMYDKLKFSDYKAKKFHPLIVTVGSLRLGDKGLIDMDSRFQAFANEAGFVLHDKLFTENMTPGAGFTFRRNYIMGFVTKNYETTLVFLKYRDEEI